MAETLHSPPAATAASSSARTAQIARWRELRRRAAACIAAHAATPPMPLHQLVAMATDLAANLGIADAQEVKLLTVFLHNEAWRETVAGIPFARRLLLLPHCLRSRKDCPADHDEFGLLCEACGRCPLGALQREATDLGYAVLIAEGSEAAAGMLREGELDAVLGVSCLPALEKSFSRLAAESLPALAIPLLRDGCDDTDVDLDHVRECIRLSGPPTGYPGVTVEQCRAEVSHWFAPASLRARLALEPGPAADIALAWMGGAGKRWRPLLATSVFHALSDDAPSGTCIEAAALATECFHKASLIHDDIEDHDDSRYGEPTLHRQHGIPIALNVGDLLIGAGYRLLACAPTDDARRLRMLAIASDAHIRLCAGQGEELHWRERAETPTLDARLQMFARKTAPAFEVAILLGAVAGGADAATCDALAAFSRSLGIAYQIHDDLQDADSAMAADGPALRETHRLAALDALTPLHNVPLKTVLTRLVVKILADPESVPDDPVQPRP